MSDISICPICGKEMTVVGNTTLHYECLECNKQREELADILQQKYHEITNINPWLLVADFILEREKEIHNKAFKLGFDAGRLDVDHEFLDKICMEARLDERKLMEGK